MTSLIFISSALFAARTAESYSAGLGVALVGAIGFAALCLYHKPKPKLQLQASLDIASFVGCSRVVKKVRDLDLRSMMRGEAKPSSKAFEVFYANWKRDQDQLKSLLVEWEQELQAMPVGKNPTEKKIWENSTLVIEHMMTMMAHLVKNYRVIVAKDAKGEIQALAVCKIGENSCELHCLATAPQNLDIECNRSKESVRGAGSAIMHHLIKTALLYHIENIQLRALKEAEPFYCSLGFEESQNDLYTNILPLRKVVGKAYSAI